MISAKVIKCISISWQWLISEYCSVYCVTHQPFLLYFENFSVGRLDNRSDHKLLWFLQKSKSRKNRSKCWRHRFERTQSKPAWFYDWWATFSPQFRIGFLTPIYRRGKFLEVSVARPINERKFVPNFKNWIYYLTSNNGVQEFSYLLLVVSISGFYNSELQHLVKVHFTTNLFWIVLATVNVFLKMFADYTMHYW